VINESQDDFSVLPSNEEFCHLEVLPLRLIRITEMTTITLTQCSNIASGVPRGRGVWGVQPPPSRNSEDIGGVLDRTSKKNRRLDFLLQFTVLSYGCNLLNKGFF